MLFVELVAIPVAICLVFKAGILLSESERDNFTDRLLKFLNVRNISQIVLINLLPRFINNVFLGIYGNKLNALNILPYSVLFKLAVYVLLIYIDYKFFAANYYFVLNESSANEAISSSFARMSKNYFKYLGLTFSFFLWFLLEMIIYYTIKVLIVGDFHSVSDVFMPKYEILNLFGFGIEFFLTPYVYLSYSNFIKGNKEDDSQKKDKRKSK